MSLNNVHANTNGSTNKQKIELINTQIIRNIFLTSYTWTWKNEKNLPSSWGWGTEKTKFVEWIAKVNGPVL